MDPHGLSSKPLRVLVSAKALAAHGAQVRRVFGAQPCELVAAESVDEFPEADLSFVTRDVTGASLKNRVEASTQRFYNQLRNSSKLRWVQMHSSGADRPIFIELQKRGVVLTTASGSNGPVVVQSALAGFLALARHFPALMAAQRARQWKPLIVSGLPRDLQGQTAVIVGWGPIGRQLATHLKVLGLEVIVVRNQSTPAGENFATATFAALHELLPRADWVFLACPLTDKTRGLMDRRAFAAMPRGAHLINVARGEVVIEVDLVQALQSGQLGGAYLDVFAEEPLPPTSALWAFDNVIVTPHSAGQSDGNNARVVEIFLANLAVWLAGKPLRNLVP